MGTITSFKEFRERRENGTRILKPPELTKADVEREASSTVRSIAEHAGRAGCITEHGTHHLLQPEARRMADELKCAENILFDALNEITLMRIKYERQQDP